MESGTDPQAATTSRRGGWGLAIAVSAVVLLIVVGVVVAVALGGGDDGEGPETVTIVVPRGTADRQARGETVELMPTNLDLHVGDTLRVTNEDIVTQTVGPYIVGPEQTLRQTFYEPGEIQGVCTLSASGEVTITITE